MTWWKNCLLLAAGGVAGLALAAWLESECEKESSEAGGCSDLKVDGIELLVEKVRRDAQWAMDECTTDEEREKVYADVSASIHKLQTTLQQRGVAIIADLKEQVLNAGDIEDLDESIDNAVRQFKSDMEDLTKALDETLVSVKTEPAV